MRERERERIEFWVLTCRVDPEAKKKLPFPGHLYQFQGSRAAGQWPQGVDVGVFAKSGTKADRQGIQIEEEQMAPNYHLNVQTLSQSHLLLDTCTPHFQAWESKMKGSSRYKITQKSKTLLPNPHGSILKIFINHKRKSTRNPPRYIIAGITARQLNNRASPCKKCYWINWTDKNKRNAKTKCWEYWWKINSMRRMDQRRLGASTKNYSGKIWLIFVYNSNFLWGST